MNSKQIAARVAIIAGIVVVVLAAALLVFRPDGLFDGAQEFGRNGAEHFFRDGRMDGMGSMNGAARGIYRGGWRIFGFGFGLLWPLIIGLIVVAGLNGRKRRRFWTHRHHDRDNESGMDTLDRMFAEGEIGEEEYLARREVLRRGRDDSEPGNEKGERS